MVLMRQCIRTVRPINYQKCLIQKLNGASFENEQSSAKKLDHCMQWLTRISGYCASNTECSDHSLKKYKVYKLMSFFFGVV